MTDAVLQAPAHPWEQVQGRNTGMSETCQFNLNSWNHCWMGVGKRRDDMAVPSADPFMNRRLICSLEDLRTGYDLVPTSR